MRLSGKGFTRFAIGKRKRSTLIAAALALVVSGSAAAIQPSQAAAQVSSKASYEAASLSTFSSKFAAGLYSSNAILIDLGNGEVQLKKNINQKVYPASMTKMMTVLVALENLSDPQKKVTLPASIFPDLKKQGASMAGFLPGEKVKGIDLLYGSMLPSGADASIGLAYAISGSEAAFVKKMNAKAKKLGMKHTHFTNVTGLHNANHYTTVKDMSVLMKAALKNSTFRKLMTTHKYSTAPTNLHPNGITVRSTLSESAPTLNFKGGRILGGKTGYTRAAGLCLASLAVKNGREYMLVTAGADGSPWSKPYHIQDALNVYPKIKN
ncbi:D-alanyl-D-alanine carboxypeptidase family protein [Saccharibacillus qingshengii]|uniref:D-alanyl-D-alanine carboxypeptidase family protein n=1 Tax=Saccharibacillus qingshengii TaxID=1763540 RepID=UPI001FEA0618|nr:serine hydrolase [Saccharibacillus qingshengii]